MRISPAWLFSYTISIVLLAGLAFGVGYDYGAKYSETQAMLTKGVTENLDKVKATVDTLDAIVASLHARQDAMAGVINKISPLNLLTKTYNHRMIGESE